MSEIEWRPLAGRLAADVAGPDGAHRIVFLHGFTQTGNTWKRLAARFVADGHQAITIDLPGHGDSADVRADLRRTADMVASLGGPATYVGYSLGGRVALHVALMYPHLVDRLALVGATAGIDDEDERARRRESDAELARHMEDIGLEAFLKEWTALPLFGGFELSPPAMADRMRNTVEGLCSSLRHAGTGAQGTLWPRLRELNMPVLAMAGADDAKFAASAQQIAGQVPRGRSLLIANAAHAAHLQQPDAFTDALRAFLAS